MSAQDVIAAEFERTIFTRKGALDHAEIALDALTAAGYAVVKPPGSADDLYDRAEVVYAHAIDMDGLTAEYARRRVVIFVLDQGGGVVSYLNPRPGEYVDEARQMEVDWEAHQDLLAAEREAVLDD